MTSHGWVLLLAGLFLSVAVAKKDKDLPRPRFVVLGQQGVGKSSISNALLGYDNTATKKQRSQAPFEIGHGLASKTKHTTFSTGQWMGNGAVVTIVDTPGFQDKKDAAFVEELTTVLGDEIPEIDAFLIIYRYKDRFTSPFVRTLNMLSKMFGDIWPNVAVAINFWDAGLVHKKERAKENITEDSYRKDIQEAFKSQIGELNHDLPVFFLDAHFTRDDDVEATFFEAQATNLYKTANKMSTFVCSKREDIMSKIKESKGKFDRQRKRELKKQMKLRNELNTCMTNLKSSQSMAEFYETNSPSVQPGCVFGDWGEWSTCEEGKKIRRRPKLANEDGECAGEEIETEEGCTEYYSNNWLEDPNNVAYSFGGLLGDEGGKASTRVYSNSKTCTAPEFPVWRQKMAAAYAPGQGIMACGGWTKKGSPSDQCWVFKEGKKEWEEAPKTNLKLAGSSGVWYKGEFWLLGGNSAKENDKDIANKNENTKGLKYNPSTETWSEIDAGFVKPYHSACVVNINDFENGETLFITGGTSAKIELEKDSPGRRVAYMLNEVKGNGKWTSYPEMKLGRASHSCTVATIEGNLGVVVAGGTHDGDTVEFFDWEEQRGWTGLQRMGRQRGIGPGMAYIRGKLHMIGGYDWPYTVTDVEIFNRVDGSWSLDSAKQGKRFNHVALTVPAKLFPTCQLKKGKGNKTK